MERELSDRLLNVLVYLAEGKGTREIAATTNFSQRTVKNDINALFAVFGVTNRTGLIAKALREGVIE